jgi:hypothetical protein
MPSFVKTYQGTLGDSVKELEGITECGGDIDVHAAEDLKSFQAVITVLDEHLDAFMHCVGRFVDEHTVSGWQEQIDFELRAVGDQSVPIHKDYPEDLTMDQADEFSVFHSFDSEAAALKKAKKIDGQLYTQVDVEGSEGVMYMRGHHLVNRTGWYIVVKK